MAFHERLTTLRKATGMTQKDCAAALGMESSKYNKWENGNNRPDFENVCKLADFFNVTTDYLLGRTDSSSQTNNDIGLTGPNVNLISKRITDTKLPPDYQSRDKRSLLDVFNQFLSDVNFYDLLCAFQIATGYLPSHKRPGYDKTNGVVYETNDDSIHELFMRKRVHTLIDAMMDNVQELAAASPEETPRTKKVKFMNGKVIIETDSK